jgi:hypothetical protein
LMTEGQVCKVLAQYLDCCVCYPFTSIPLPAVPASEFRRDRPQGLTVMMPKLDGSLLWQGTVAEHQPRIGLAL